MEGGTLYGLTAALKGEITIQNGRVVQHHFNDYQMIRHNEAPEVEVHIVPSAEDSRRHWRTQHRACGRRSRQCDLRRDRQADLQTAYPSRTTSGITCLKPKKAQIPGLVLGICASRVFRHFVPAH